MLYIYSGKKSSESSLALAEALDAKRLRKFDGLDFWKAGRRKNPVEGDVILCWGGYIPEMEGVRVLNAGSPMNRYAEYVALSKSMVNTIPKLKPVDFGRKYDLKRTLKGSCVRELLVPPSDYCYTMMRMIFTHEYRVHAFEGRGIRSGEKVIRDGFSIAASDDQWESNLIAGGPNLLAHPWIRTWNTGWRVKYEGFKTNARLRNTALAAVKALELTFGAVDIGYNVADERYYVIKVNRAPILDEISLRSYVRAIQRWVKNEKAEAEEGEEALPAFTPPEALPEQVVFNAENLAIPNYFLRAPRPVQAEVAGMYAQVPGYDVEAPGLPDPPMDYVPIRPRAGVEEILARAAGIVGRPVKKPERLQRPRVPVNGWQVRVDDPFGPDNDEG